MTARLIRFVGVGGVATLVHVSAALIGREVVGLSEMTANWLGWLSALTISYLGHLHVTFAVVPSHGTQLPRFIIIAAGGLVVSSATVALVTLAGGNFELAMVSVAVAVPLASYLLIKVWVFADGNGATFRRKLCFTSISHKADPNA